MKGFVILIIGLMASSCATQKRSVGKPVSDLVAKDFVKPPAVKYQENYDYYNTLGALGQMENSLIGETLHKAPHKGINLGILMKENDKDSSLTSLAHHCYGKDFERAFVIIDNLYLKYKEHPGYWNQVGNCYLLQNDLKKADIFYKQALKYNKNYSPAYNNIGNIHVRRREYRKAFNAFKKAHELSKSALTPAYNLAHVYLSFGMIHEAQKLFLNINQARPGDPLVLGGLATTYLFQGNIKKSLTHFNKISSNDLRLPAIGLNYAVALHLDGNKSLAKRTARRVEDDKREWGNYYKSVNRLVRQR